MKQKQTNEENVSKEQKGVKITQYSLIRNIVDSFYDIQRLRIATDNRLHKMERAEIVATEHYDRLLTLSETLNREERLLNEYLDGWIKTQPIASNWLLKQKGIGTIMASNLVAMIDIKRAKHISSLWKYAGLYPNAKLRRAKREDKERITNELKAKLGREPERKEIENEWKKYRETLKSPFNATLRMTCYKIGTQLLMAKNQDYEPIYRSKKEEYLKREGMSKLHAELMARRYMVKMFLRDLWLRWRALENLPVSEPYPVAILGHQKQPERIEESKE